MGTGIAAAIPIAFEQYRDRELDERYFPKGFLDNFNVKKSNGEKTYSIKTDLLINNYKSFLIEFYNLIEEDFFESTQLTFDNIPDANNLDEFLKVFNRDARNGMFPFMETHYGFFSVSGCKCQPYWMFYIGSYKAILEEYTTLLHFEKILAKAMSNPLANAVKFGIFG